MSSPHNVAKGCARYVCKIAYNGAKFHGWAIQPDVLTVQGQLQKALTNLYQKSIKVYGSGRTDAGVHATAQVFHFDAPTHIKPQSLQTYLNNFQKGCWWVFDIKKTHKPFHARFDVKQKTYCYQIKSSSYLDPLLYDQVWQLDTQISLTKLNVIKKLFIGEHNFLSFTTEAKENNIRHIYKIGINKKNDIIFIKITGNGFLQGMVRMIVGAMVNYATGKISFEQCQSWLTHPKKGQSNLKAPACGLYMVKVKY